MAHLRDMLLWVALIAFAMTVGDVMAYGGGNCTTILAHPVYLHAPSGAMVLIHNGKAGTLSSSINGVIPDGAFNVTIAVTALMERLRSDGSNGDRCYVPRTFHSPYETEDSNGHIYAPYVSNFTMADFDCYIYNYSYVKEGVTIYALTSKSSLHSDPTFHALVTYEFPTESLTVYPSQNTTYTYGIPYANSWTKDQLKITLEFINFPWVDDLASVNSSSSFISAHFLTSVNLPAGLGYFRTTADSVQFSFNTSSSPKQSLFFEFEACWLVDGVPICSRGDDVANSFPLTVPDGAQYNYAIPMGVPLCSSAVGHWQHSIYDPQMSILFDADPTDSITTPATPTAAKQRQIVKIVAPVVVVGVVLLAVIFIVVVFNTPSLKAKFMPSRVETDAFDEPRSSASHSYASSTPASATPTSPSTQSTSQSPTSTKAQKKAWKQSVRPTV